MRLPEELEQLFWQEIDEYEEEKKMPYITSVERIGMQRGMREGLLSGIELGLELKFGNEGLQLVPEIYQIEDVDLLKAIQGGIKNGILAGKMAESGFRNTTGCSGRSLFNSSICFA